MIDAALDGVIDFSQADTYDPRWWLKVCWLTDRLEERKEVESLRAFQTHHLFSMLATSADGVSKHWDKARDLMFESYDRTFPWRADSEKRRSAPESGLASWKAAFGDPNDPAVQKAIAATVEALNKQMAP